LCTLLRLSPFLPPPLPSSSLPTPLSPLRPLLFLHAIRCYILPLPWPSLLRPHVPERCWWTLNRNAVRVQAASMLGTELWAAFVVSLGPSTRVDYGFYCILHLLCEQGCVTVTSWHRPLRHYYWPFKA
jgi:hypothetical protein